ncbi:MAG TPA: TonB-dependent receptor, partial [Candidatus Eisenbacteria bacterium]
IAFVAAWLAIIAATPAISGTTGKISGQVLNSDKQPVVAATVLVVGQKLGAVTDAAGKYNILNVPAGTYDLSVGRLGFEKQLLTGLQVRADETVFQDFTLGTAAVEMKEVVITAERPTVDVNLTSTKQTLTTEEIEDLPVQDLEDVVNLQAGVVDGHFRGGRSGEVQYQVDGVSINNAYDNQPTLIIDRSLLQEVQVLSGTFDAEYGQAMSGVVNAVLKDGTPEFEWAAEIYGGSWAFSNADDRRLTTDVSNPTAIQSYQLNLSGPLLGKETVFLVSGRHYHYDDYITAERRFTPTDSSDFAGNVFTPTGDGGDEPLGYSREWSGVAKLTSTAVHNARINYQALFNDIEGRRTNFAWRYNPDGASLQTTRSINHGLDWTQTLSSSTFLDATFRHSYLHYTDHAYDDLYDPRYDDAGPGITDDAYEEGANIQGVDFTRFEQKTNAFLLKSAVVSQLSAEHQVKVGGEIQWPEVSFGNPGYLTYTTVNGVQTLVRHDNEPPDFPGVVTYNPVIAAAHVQEAAELRNLTVRSGLRLDYFDANSFIPGDLANPANAIEGVPTAPPKATTTKVVLAPRLGVAFPVGQSAALHFAYGHFYQFPAIGTVFSNADYSVLSNLQVGDVSYGVLGNPDVKPEKTIQYEFGYKHALSLDMGIDGTLFYKDVRDLLGAEFVSTYNGAEYARLTNTDFGDVLGFTLAFDHRHLGPLVLGLDYTWQQAIGNSSDPRETATRASAGEDPRPRLVSFNWDQRHTLNLTLAYRDTRGFSSSFVLRAGSGQPYTPVIESGFGNGLETNSGRKPTATQIDLRAEKGTSFQNFNVGLYGRVFNLLDSRFFNGAVFNSTGSPYYSRFPEADEVALNDPSRFYQPRRIEFGLKFSPKQDDTTEKAP